MATLKNPRHEKFAQALAAGSTAEQAYKLAGYSGHRGNAARLRQDAAVIARIEEIQAPAAAKAAEKVEAVLEELSRIGFADIRELVNEDGTIRDVKDWPDTIARAVASIEVKELFGESGLAIGYTKKIKFWNKVQALELLGTNKGLFVKSHKHDVGGTLAELIAASMKEGA